MVRRSHGVDVIASAGIIIAIFFFVYQYAGTLNVDPSVGQTLFRLLPGFIVTIICLYIAAQSPGMGRLGGMMGAGAGLCFLLSAMDGEGLITVDMFYGLTLTQLHIWVLGGFTLLGAILSAWTR